MQGNNIIIFKFQKFFFDCFVGGGWREKEMEGRDIIQEVRVRGDGVGIMVVERGK